jgi:hypothetical protein
MGAIDPRLYRWQPAGLDSQLQQFSAMISAQGRGGAMKLRIAIWAMAGALVAALWSVYFVFYRTHSQFGVPWALVDLTMPIALVRHYAMSVYFVLLVNAATYALVGTFGEILWRLCKQHPPRRFAN